MLDRVRFSFDFRTKRLRVQKATETPSIDALK
jgi:hypothetical protein